jgi:chromosome segregation ATPase
VSRGALAGAYWAVMTHQTISKEMLSTIYGEMHMFGYDHFDQHRREQVQQDDLRRKVEAMEEVLGSERQYYLEEKRVLELEVSRLDRELDEVSHLVKENEILRNQLGYLQGAISQDHLEQANKELQQKVSDLQQQNAELCGRLDELASELDDSKDLNELAYSTVDELEENNSVLAKEKLEMEQEIASLETALLVK